MLDLRLDDVLRLRKPHPCGGYEWRVVRLGADIGLQCLTCERRVLLTRREVEKRTKTIVQRGVAASSPNPPEEASRTTERQPLRQASPRVLSHLPREVRGVQPVEGSKDRGAGGKSEHDC